jgi:hypothetical protein
VKEAKLWEILRNGMRGRWHAVRIEDCLSEGVPDVSYGIPSAQGWIELKVLYAFPKRPDTKVKVDHWTSEQKLWMRSRGSISGDVWLFIAVDLEFFLFWWDRALQCENWTADEWRSRANGYWKDKIDFNDFYDTLC